MYHPLLQLLPRTVPLTECASVHTQSLTQPLHIASHPHRPTLLPPSSSQPLQDSGAIDFHEFVIALYNYCTMGKPGLTMFSFDLYDVDNSG